MAVLGIILPHTAESAENAVHSVRVGTHPDKTRLVVELSNSMQFRAFSLQNPARIVLDLPAVQWGAGNLNNMSQGPVTGIRHGILQAGISRVVIDLKQNSSIKSAFILPAGPSVSDRIVIDFSSTSNNQPTQDRVFGNLTTPPPSMNLGSTTPNAPSPPPVNDTLVPSSNKNKQKPIIVIDPGHGGGDPGALGANGKKEKDVTLATAKELKAQLEGSGRYIVHLTRTNDVFIKLQDRVKIARKHNADLFISLHADSIDKPNVSGASIYTLSNKASDAQTEKLAARENQADLIAGVDLSHEDKEVANILIDLAMRDTMNQSKFFANTVVKKASATGIDLLEKPHRYAGFAVLKAPDIPSVLVEMGFMSNRREVDKLSTPEYRKRIAGSLVNGIDAYFAKVQKNGQE